MIAGEERWSCARLAQESAHLAEGLCARDVQAGDRIALHMYNLPELVLAYLACWRARRFDSWTEATLSSPTAKPAKC